jgi:murein DD-endopeptidase MepM/ murein hydrolase activator NlpD
MSKILFYLKSLGFLLLLPGLLYSAGLQYVWPTPNRAFLEKQPIETFIQPTQSGQIASGLFGCVRNNGQRFHEGIDLLTITRDKRGEAADAVFAAMDGVIVHVSSIAGKSNYGRYVVIEHKDQGLTFYSLYAHLARIDEGLRSGVEVNAGRVIGLMGRSATGTSIPKERAHLHFEVGLRLSDDFQSWYDKQGYKARNDHRNYNGMNLLGMDPMGLYSALISGAAENPFAYVRQLPVAYRVQVINPKVPDFLLRNRGLLKERFSVANLKGWQIGFTAWGLPVEWTPIQAEIPEGTARVKLLSADETLVQAYSCRHTIRTYKGRSVIGEETFRILDLLF